jgi:ABC-2 type transport system permease protein
MRNVLIIARKEFVDILSNRMVLFILILFAFYVVTLTYDFGIVVSGGRPGERVGFDDNNGVAAANYILYILTWCGAIIGVVIGCSTISTERMGHALNTLITKPVYRDTIINGKIVGSLIFFAAYIFFIMLIFTAGFLAFSGNFIAPYLTDYYSRLPAIFILILLYIGVFLSLSLLVSILVRNQALAMVLSVIIVYISEQFVLSNVLENLDNILPGLGLSDILTDISPKSVANQAHLIFMHSWNDANTAFFDVLPGMQKLLLMIIIGMVLSYIVFVKRDIS